MFLELPTDLLYDSLSILRIYVSGHMDLVSHIQRCLPRRKEMVGALGVWKESFLERRFIDTELSARLSDENCND